MRQIKQTIITRTIFFVGFLIILQFSKSDNLPDPIWETEIIKRIYEIADSSIGIIKTGNSQGFDPSIQIISEQWQACVEQEEEIFDGEIAKPESLGILKNLVSINIRQLKNVYVLGDTNKVQYLFEELTGYSKEILGYIAKPALLVFMGAKCKSWPNCKAGQRTMESVDNIASKFANKIRISIIDIKKNKRLAKQYKIMLTPTLVIMDPYGKEVFRKPGESTDFLIEDELNKLVGKQ